MVLRESTSLGHVNSVHYICILHVDILHTHLQHFVLVYITSQQVCVYCLFDSCRLSVYIIYR